MKKIILNGDWLAHGGEFSDIKSTVPGCIHTDLLANDLIDDPYYRDNEDKLLWIGETDWTYKREFDIKRDFLSSDNIKLVCKGLDTLSQISINGKTVASTDNMFREWEFDVKKYLVEGTNSIEVKLVSTTPYINEKIKERWLLVTGIGHHRLVGSNYVRKMQCNYGWDWGPMCVTAGIWRDIELIAYDNVKIDDVWVKQFHNDGIVDLDITTELDAVPCNMKVSVDVTLDGEVVAQKISDATSQNVSTTFTIDNPNLWWPNNLGDQTMYDIKVFLLDNKDNVVHTKSTRIGLRTLVLDRHDDQWGESFQFVVNGVPFFAKGANWIPIDTFVTRGSDEFYRQLLEDAKLANMNMIRVWGGGIYESDLFYKFCDELGLCVWQDFMFACSAYPVQDEFMDTFRHEVVDNVKRLRNHPSIALWCGNNELEHMGYIITDEVEDGTMSWDEYKYLFEDVIPTIINEYDGQHDYWASSPMTPGNRLEPNDPTRGDAHLWEVWHGREPFEWYRGCEHRFNSEFGFQSFPEPEVVRSYTNEEDRNITSYVMERHQRSGIGNDAILQYMLSWFMLPTSFDMLLWTSQILQSLAIKYAVEHWRRKMPQGMGTLYWQINDCWPVASWSSIDYIGNWKALHYSAKHFFNPVLISGVEDKDDLTLELHLTNDTLEPLSGNVVWSLLDLKGGIIRKGSFDANVGANTSSKVKKLDLSDDIKEAGGIREVIVFYAFEVDGKVLSENTTYFERPKHLKLEAPEYDVDITEVDTRTYTLTLRTDKPSLWVWPELNGVKARYSDRFFHLNGKDGKIVMMTLEKDSTLAEVEESLTVNSIVDTYKY